MKSERDKRVSAYYQNKYRDNPTKEMLKLYMNELFQNKLVSQTVELLTRHIEQYGLDRDLVVLSDKLFVFLRPILKKHPHLLDCRLDMVKLLVAVRNFWTAASFLEKAVEYQKSLDIDPLRTWLITRWKPYMGARRFINPKYSLDEFFDHINQRNIRYVILRWFETLPKIVPGEDIDFLVDDRDLDAFNEFLVPYGYNNAQKVDVYTPTGQLGTAYQDVPYYQANLAFEILDNRICFKHKYYVPSSLQYLLSLAYHVVYHKAEDSGLPCSRSSSPKGHADHDYQKVLSLLCRQTGSDEPEYTLEGLHEFLYQRSWAPSIDLIRKYDQNRKGWLSSFFPKSYNDDGLSGALTVFVLRERGLQMGLYEELKNALLMAGFEIIYHANLSGDAKKQAGFKLRGGNWGKGPFPISGGFPAAAFVAYDQMPSEPSEKVKKQHPFVNNMLSLDIKTYIRKMCNQRLPAQQHFNPLHSCDDNIEAREYIDILFKEQKEEIYDKLQQVVNSFHTVIPVISDLTKFGRRAKVELIQSNGSPNILKTYKSGRKRFMEREIFAFGTLSKRIPYIPKLLDQGDNWLKIEYIKESNQSSKGSLILKHLHQLFDFMNHLFGANYAHLDFNPNNILFTEDERMYVVDYEFLYPYIQRPANIMESYDIAGYPNDLQSDKPAGGFKYINHLWRHHVGCSLIELVQKHATLSIN